MACCKTSTSSSSFPYATLRCTRGSGWRRRVVCYSAARLAVAKRRWRTPLRMSAAFHSLPSQHLKSSPACPVRTCISPAFIYIVCACLWCFLAYTLSALPSGTVQPALLMCGVQWQQGAGESEATVRALFAAAAAAAPAILFIDELDAIAPKREAAAREMERRIVAQLLASLDALSAPVAEPSRQDGAAPAPAPHVVVLAATNRPEALDTCLLYTSPSPRD